MTTLSRLMNYSSHLPQTVIIMLGGVWLGADPVAVAWANAAWWLSREGSQAENRYLRRYPGTQLSRWAMWFEREAWNFKSMNDWILPSVAGFFLAKLLGG